MAGWFHHHVTHPFFLWRWWLTGVSLHHLIVPKVSVSTLPSLCWHSCTFWQVVTSLVMPVFAFFLGKWSPDEYIQTYFNIGILILFRYGKAKRPGNNCHQKDIVLHRDPRGKEDTIEDHLEKYQNQSGRRTWGEALERSFYFVVSMGRNSQSRVSRHQIGQSG